MRYIKNKVTNNKEYFNFIFNKAIETNCENTIKELFNYVNLLQIYNQINKIFESEPDLFNKERKIDYIKKIFLYKDKIYMQDIFGYACTYGYYETVEYLINQDIDIHTDYKTKNAILKSELYHHYDIVEYLIKNGADIHVSNDELLEIAISDNNIERTKYWILKGLNIHTNNERNLYFSIQTNNIKMAKFIIDNGANIHIDNDKLLDNAIACNYFKMTKYLISIGANINACNCRCLETSIYCHHFQISDYLIENGANINLHVKDYYKYANKNNDESIINYLKSKGFNNKRLIKK